MSYPLRCKLGSRRHSDTALTDIMTQLLCTVSTYSKKSCYSIDVCGLSR